MNPYVTGYAYGACRLLGHMWHVVPSDWTPSFGVPMTVRCERCDIERRDSVNRHTGEVQARRYTYPKGYNFTHEEGIELPRRQDFRVAWLEGVINESRKSRGIARDQKRARALARQQGKREPMTNTENRESTWPTTAQAIIDGGDALDQQMRILDLAEARASVALDGDTHSDLDADREAAETVARLIGPPVSQVPNIDPHEIVRRIGLPVVENENGMHVCPVCNVPFEHAQSMGPHFRLHWQEAGVAYADIPKISGRVKCPECQVPLVRTSLSGHLNRKHQYSVTAANGIARVFGFSLDAYLTPPKRPTVADTRLSTDAPAKPKGKKHIGYEARLMQFVACPFDDCGAVQKRKYIMRHVEAVHGVEHVEARRQAMEYPATRHTKAVKSKMKGSIGRPRHDVPRKNALAVVEHVDPPPLFEAQAGFDFTAISASDIAIGVVQSQLNGMMPTSLLPDVVMYVEDTRAIIDKLRAARP